MDLTLATPSLKFLRTSQLITREDIFDLGLDADASDDDDDDDDEEEEEEEDGKEEEDYAWKGKGRVGVGKQARSAHWSNGLWGRRGGGGLRIFSI